MVCAGEACAGDREGGGEGSVSDHVCFLSFANHFTAFRLRVVASGVDTGRCPKGRPLFYGRGPPVMELGVPTVGSKPMSPQSSSHRQKHGGDVAVAKETHM